MNDVLWIASFVLCAVYLSGGALKLGRSHEALRESLPWVERFDPAAVKLIGVVEVLGAIGVVLPWLSGVLPVLTPLAACGLVVLQALAIRVHLQRREPRVIPFNALLLVGALVLALLRFAEL